MARRSGLPARKSCRGDLLLLAEGDRVPADGRLVEVNDLLVDESLLTGESLPVDKAAGKPVFSGTMVVKGQARAEVLATGSRTEFGRIGRALASVETEVTPLQAETARLVKVITGFAIALSVLATALYVYTRGDWLGGALAGLTLAMSMVPQEFPIVLTVFLAMGAWRISRDKVLTRRMPAIEALGSATVLCVDKTGNAHGEPHGARGGAGERCRGHAPRRGACLRARSVRPDGARDPRRGVARHAGDAAGVDARTRLSLRRGFPRRVPRLALAAGCAPRRDQGRRGNRDAALRDGPCGDRGSARAHGGGRARAAPARRGRGRMDGCAAAGRSSRVRVSLAGFRRARRSVARGSARRGRALPRRGHPRRDDHRRPPGHRGFDRAPGGHRCGGRRHHRPGDRRARRRGAYRGGAPGERLCAHRAGPEAAPGAGVQGGGRGRGHDRRRRQRRARPQGRAHRHRDGHARHRRGARIRLAGAAGGRFRLDRERGPARAADLREHRQRDALPARGACADRRHVAAAARRRLADFPVSRCTSCSWNS